MLRDELNDALKTAMKARDERTTQTLRMVLAGLKDKDIAGVMTALKGAFTRWHLAAAEGPRAAGAEELRASLGDIGAPTLLFPGVAEAWREACKNARDDDKIIVFGSFLTVAAVMRENGG